MRLKEEKDYVAAGIISHYLWRCLATSSLKQIIRESVRKLNPYRNQFDTIAYCGSSGCIVAPSICLEMNKEQLLVRKSRSNSHARHLVEGNYQARRILLVDDFTCSGATVRRMLARIKKALPFALVVAVYTYVDKLILDKMFGLEGFIC